VTVKVHTLVATGQLAAKKKKKTSPKYGSNLIAKQMRFRITATYLIAQVSGYQVFNNKEYDAKLHA